MVVGTSSIRRRHSCSPPSPASGSRELRGNVDTRLQKLARGVVDAAVLAAAGLFRLGIEPAHVGSSPCDEMVPAPGQGCLAIQMPSRGPPRRRLAWRRWITGPRTSRSTPSER